LCNRHPGYGIQHLPTFGWVHDVHSNPVQGKVLPDGNGEESLVRGGSMVRRYWTAPRYTPPAAGSTGWGSSPFLRATSSRAIMAWWA
jgi:hypothetical protein